MSYFPFFIDVCDKEILVVGGGKVAYRKAQKLMEFGAKIKIVAKDVCEEFGKLDVTVHKREFSDKDIKNAFCVIAATDDEQLNEYIFRLCQDENILINTVDDKEKCSFIFPAISKNGDITAAVTTNGKSPFVSSFVREKIDDVLTDNLSFAVEILGEYRKDLQEIYSDTKTKNHIISLIFEICMNEKKSKAKEKVLKLLEEGKNENNNCSKRI
ncbi:MAG: bifunctional precorrin-2 dehydrogenase/sirohydrochlorin ferrochelatase [Ruminococcus sp.]|nr:bifunctional precorrin-2 dehydrogenase/sirohydrochlorin ferrochelatase [Ruminococcus sp.]